MSGQVQVSVQRDSLIHNESLMHNYSKIDTNEFKQGSWSSYGKNGLKLAIG